MTRLACAAPLALATTLLGNPKPAQCVGQCYSSQCSDSAYCGMRCACAIPYGQTVGRCVPTGR